MEAWIDGRFVDWTEARVPILSHAFGRGAAVFEVLKISATQNGPAFFLLQEHIDRFFHSAGLMGLDLPVDKKGLAQVLSEAARRNRVRGGAAKFFAYLGDPCFKALPESRKADLAVFCGDHETFGMDTAKFCQPIKVGVTSYAKLPPASVPIKAKTTGFYANAYLAALEMEQKGYKEPIFLDTEGFVREGGTQNQFFVRGGTIMTAPLSRVLTGTTRGAVIEVAKALGHQVEEKDLRPQDLLDLDEAFGTGSISGITPFEAIDGRRLGSACPGPITAELMAGLGRAFTGTWDRFKSWLTYI